MSRTLEFDPVKALIQRLPVDLSRASESLTKLRAVLVRGTIAAQDLERAEKRRRVRESRIRWRVILENAESAFRWWRP